MAGTAPSIRASACVASFFACDIAPPYAARIGQLRRDRPAKAGPSGHTPDVRRGQSSTRAAFREVSVSLGRLWLQHRIEVLEQPELAQDHGSRRIAVEHLKAAVLELEDIAAGRIHPVPRRCKNPLR